MAEVLKLISPIRGMAAGLNTAPYVVFLWKGR